MVCGSRDEKKEGMGMSRIGVDCTGKGPEEWRGGVLRSWSICSFRAYFRGRRQEKDEVADIMLWELRKSTPGIVCRQQVRLNNFACLALSFTFISSKHAPVPYAELVSR